MNELKYQGASVFVEYIPESRGYEFEVFSNFDDAKLGGGFHGSLERIMSQFKSPGDKILWHKSGMEIKIGA